MVEMSKFMIDGFVRVAHSFLISSAAWNRVAMVFGR